MIVGKHRFLNTRNLLIVGLCFKLIGDAMMTQVTVDGPMAIPYALGCGFLAMVRRIFPPTACISCMLMFPPGRRRLGHCPSHRVHPALL